jgi:hypothetical protein
MRVPRPQRRWVVAALVVVLVFIGYRLLDSATWIYYYRVLDDRTLVVGTVAGPGAWTRVTGITETPTTITITVSSLFLQLGPGTAEGVPYESVAKLRDPIGDRSVVDGSSGLPVLQTHCPPPSYSAPGCT